MVGMQKILVTLTDGELAFLDQEAKKFNLPRSTIVRLLLMNNQETDKALEKLAPVASQFLGRSEAKSSVFSELLQRL